MRLHLGEAGAALKLLSEWDSRERPGSGPNYVAYLPEAVRTALAAGDDGLAARLAGGIDSVLPMRRHVLATTQGLLAERRGEYETAAAVFADAAAGWHGFAAPLRRGSSPAWAGALPAGARTSAGSSPPAGRGP